MSETTERSGNAIATAGDGLAVTKRSLQMRQFKSATAIQKCVKEQVIVTLGQIVGHVLEVRQKQGTLPDGTNKSSAFAIGDFEATVYETGEVLQAHGAYLPGYYAETLEALLTTPDGRPRNGAGSGIVFAVEIVAEPTGLDAKTGLPKSIPFAYAVRNLAKRPAGNPIDAMKRELAKAGRLRLPAPPAAEPMQIAYDGTDPEPVFPDEPGAPDAEPAEAGAGRARGRARAAAA